jgi:hypothetical protein
MHMCVRGIMIACVSTILLLDCVTVLTFFFFRIFFFFSPFYHVFLLFRFTMVVNRVNKFKHEGFQYLFIIIISIFSI